MNAEPKDAEELDWTTDGPQLYHDGWRNRNRTLRYKGDCVVCGRRTYAFDDGENDPRGVLGDRAASPLHAADHGYAGDPVPLCFPCANDPNAHEAALDVAADRWEPTDEDREEGQA